MKSLYIKNFKNIQNLTIDKLAKVNLIVGKNSVGKSSLLEAISVYLSNGNDTWLRELLDNRGELFYRLKDKEEQETLIAQRYLSFFNGRQENYSNDYAIIVGESEIDPNAVKINQIYILTEEEEDLFDGEIKIRRRAFSSEELCDSMNNSLNIDGRGLKITNGKGQVIIPYSRFLPVTSRDSRAKFQYVHTVDFNVTDNASFFDQISLSPEEKYIIQALQIINPKIARINFLNVGSSRYTKETRVPVVTLEGDNNKYLLSSMGDGINRILTIVLAMLNSKGGVLLLDEFETGLHYSVQDELWKIIFMLAKELDIQVFATSHSNDCVNSFINTNTEGDGMLIRLENRKDKISAISYTDKTELDFAMNNHIEMR